MLPCLLSPGLIFRVNPTLILSFPTPSELKTNRLNVRVVHLDSFIVRRFRSRVTYNGILGYSVPLLYY